jgi:EmrB/QacA subfamily drug resistance transporter
MTDKSGANTAHPSDSDYGQGVTKRQALLTFTIVSLALMMASIDLSIVSVAVPDLLKELNTNLAHTAWVITGYQFSQAIMMPMIGKLSDEWGRKRLFMIAVVVFTLSSVAAGISPNIFYLIIFRVIQGIGAGAFLPSATGIISDAFGKHRTTAIGLFASIFPIGSIIGPNIGGVIIDHLSWRWIFFVNVPIGILLIIGGFIILPKGSLSNIKRRIDFLGAGIFAAAMLSILYAMTDWANHPQDTPFWVWLLFVVGALLLVIFVYYESRVEQPAIELRLLKETGFLAANLYNFVFGAVIMGLFIFIPYYAVTGYNMTAVESGLILTPRSIASLVLAAITSFFIIRFRYRLPMLIGASVMIAGLVILAQGYHDVTILGCPISNVVLLAGIFAIGGIGMGIANPAANNAILDLHPEKAAAVTGLRGMFRMTGGMIGATVVVLLISSYQDKALGLQHCMLLFAGMLVLVIPLIFLIPDNARRKRPDGKGVRPDAVGD